MGIRNSNLFALLVVLVVPSLAAAQGGIKKISYEGHKILYPRFSTTLFGANNVLVKLANLNGTASTVIRVEAEDALQVRGKLESGEDVSFSPVGEVDFLSDVDVALKASAT